MLIILTSFIFFALINIIFFNFFKNHFFFFIKYLIFAIVLSHLTNFSGEIFFLEFLLFLLLVLSYKLYCPIFYLESPTLHLVNIVKTNKINNKNMLKQFFLKKKFYNYYFKYIINQRMAKLNNKNQFYLSYKGKFSYLFFKIFYRILL